MDITVLLSFQSTIQFENKKQLTLKAIEPHVNQTQLTKFMINHYA